MSTTGPSTTSLPVAAEQCWEGPLSTPSSKSSGHVDFSPTVSPASVREGRVEKIDLGVSKSRCMFRDKKEWSILWDFMKSTEDLSNDECAKKSGQRCSHLDLRGSTSNLRGMTNGKHHNLSENRRGNKVQTRVAPKYEVLKKFRGMISRNYRRGTRTFWS